jgi:hypothetical protein
VILIITIERIFRIRNYDTLLIHEHKNALWTYNENTNHWPWGMFTKAKSLLTGSRNWTNFKVQRDTMQQLTPFEFTS